MTGDEGADILEDDRDIERRQQQAERKGHVGTQPFYKFEDKGPVPIMKRTVNCMGRKVRMEYYQGEPPAFCPGCGGRFD